jgi:DNA-binding NarL/FixJ family response regulator
MTDKVIPSAGCDTRVVIRVLIVDDHQGVRMALAAALADEPDLRVCGGAADGRSAIEMTRATAPDVVVMDVAMPRMDGFAATEAILREHPGVRVLMVSCLADRGSIARALAAGASGYLSKGTDSSDVADAIRAVHRGERPDCCASREPA